MGLTVEQLKDRAITHIREYIKKNGRKVTVDGQQFYYWDSYPVVIENYCSLGVAVFNDSSVVFGNYNPKKNTFIEAKKAEDAERKYLDSAFKQMQEADKNKYKGN